MSSLNIWIRTFCATAACAAIFGCSTGNEQAPPLNGTGHHPAGWLTAHRGAYQQNRDLCRECHGSDLKGGIAKVDCFNQAGLGQCHANGHAPRNVPHLLPYKDGTVHGPAAKKDLVYCQSCHGSSGGPGSNPVFTVRIGTLVNGCEDCHKHGTAHPPLTGAATGWIGHASAGNLGNSCTLCHGIDLAGGSGPGCTTCHTALTPGTIPAAGSCNSCHTTPPVTGSHTKHNALGGVTDLCNTCHSGAGSGTAKHKNGTADVTFMAVYNAKSGVAVRNSDGSCANVSCHGGVTTPVWGGALANGCFSCHTAGTTQYNGYYSGQHNKHIVEVGLLCVDCHDMSKTLGGAGHYSGLGVSSSFRLSPSVTIRVPGYPSCSPGSTPSGYSVGRCHGSKTWN